MNEVCQKWTIKSWPEDAMKEIEEVGRDAYQSHDRMKEGSDKTFCEMIMSKNPPHLGLLEWVDIKIRIRTNRAVSHELVRHRHASYLQESQRYVNYKNGLAFITPYWASKHPEAYDIWKRNVINDETDYAYMVSALGLSAQEARDILPNSTATYINMKHNLRGWREVFELRTAPGAYHPMRLLMISILIGFAEHYPVFFQDILDGIPANLIELVRGQEAQ